MVQLSPCNCRQGLENEAMATSVLGVTDDFQVGPYWIRRPSTLSNSCLPSLLVNSATLWLKPSEFLVDTLRGVFIKAETVHPQGSSPLMISFSLKDQNNHEYQIRPGRTS